MIYGQKSVYETVFGGELPDTPAITDSQGTITYATLAEQIDDVAAHLHASGIGDGDVVGIRMGNGADFAIAFHALAKLGAVSTLLGTHLTADDVSAQLKASNAVRVLTGSDIAHLRAPRGALISPDLDIDPEQLACLPFSSGTTGKPKGVMLSHRALSANIEQFSDVLPLQSGETCLAVLPFSHIYGLTALLNVPLAVRAKIVAQNFGRESFLHAHEEHSVNVSFIAPPLATLLATDPMVEEVDFSALHTIVSGAAPLNVATARTAGKRVGARIIQGFGLTETAPVTHLAWREGVSSHSIGHPLPGTSTSIRDGELWVRGPQLMTGYLNDPDATRAVLRDGWLRTGDLVETQADGSIMVIDRIKDLIKSHGFQVSPVKLETLLLTHPDVRDAAVVRGYATDGEERPEAYVVLEDSAVLNDIDLMRFVAERVASYERIRAVHVIDAIPRSSAGKILRRVLVDARPQ